MNAIIHIGLRTRYQRPRPKQPVPPPYMSLNKREKQVLQLLARGLTNAQIAAALGLTEKTIKNYVFWIFPLLNAHTRLEAMIEAVKLGWVECPCGASHGIRQRKPRPRRVL